jgi:hypothetical protein
MENVINFVLSCIYRVLAWICNQLSTLYNIARLHGGILDYTLNPLLLYHTRTEKANLVETPLAKVHITRCRDPTM